MEKVRSRDGTPIAFERSGHGPPLIMVAGAFCDHRAPASGTPLAALLASQFTVYCYDRRGRGESGDTPPYAVAREVEDVAALLGAAGGAAHVYGMSSGAVLATEAAIAGLPIKRLALYGPPLALGAGRPALPADFPAQLDALVAAGRRGDAAELFLTRAVLVPAPVVAQMRAAPVWAGLERLAHTLAYDAALTADASSLVERAGRVGVTTLAMDGSASPQWLREGVRALAAALPAGHHRTLEGQSQDVAIGALAPVLAEFFAGG